MVLCLYMGVPVRGGILAAFQYILHYSSKIKMFQNQIGMFQNIFKKTLTNTWKFEYFEFSEH